MNRLKKITAPFLVLGVILLIFQFVITPTLSAASTILNIFGVAIGFVVGLFAYFYVDMLINGVPPSESTPEPGETELDYINPEELKPKKKRNPKQFPEVNSEETFVKTRKKKKSEYPLPPHHPIKKTNNK